VVAVVVVMVVRVFNESWVWWCRITEESFSDGIEGKERTRMGIPNQSGAFMTTTEVKTNLTRQSSK
jgi:hypothetical protein